MNILLTGATGTIGRRLCDFLTDHTVYSLARSATGLPHVHDLVIPEFTSAAMGAALKDIKIDVVIHLMAAGVRPSDRDPGILNEINRDLPPQMVSMAKQHGAQAIVIAGSSGEYRDPPSEPVSENALLETRTEKLYGSTKAAGGLAALDEGRRQDIPVAVARIFNAYGPHEPPHRLLPSLLSKLKTSEPVELSIGTQIRDFIYVDDICDALWQMAQGLLAKKLPPAAYNVCTGTGLSVADFSRLVARACNCDESLLQFGKKPMRPDDSPYLVGNPDSLEKHLGWKAKYSVAQGLAEAIAQEGPWPPSPQNRQANGNAAPGG
jgi:nucleoside-diphosphate-sugar epimerase